MGVCFSASASASASASSSPSSSPSDVPASDVHPTSLLQRDALASSLALAASRGGEHVKLYKQLDTRMWTSSIRNDSSLARERLKALAEAIDAVLVPAVDAANEELKGRGWLHTGAAKAVDFLQSAVGRDGASCVRTFLELTEAVRATCDANLAAATTSRGLERIISTLGAIWLRAVTLNTPQEVAARRRVWDSARMCVLGDPTDAAVASAISANSKALLCYVDAGIAVVGDSSLGGMNEESQLECVHERRADVRVRRGDAAVAFTDTLLAARSSSWWSSPAPRKLFPSFVAAATGVPEGGEGHGPRKELFRLIGAAMVQPPAHLPGGSPLFVERDIRTHSARGDCRALWYNAAAAAASKRLDEYEFVGYMCGQSLVNKSPLGCRFDPWLLALALRDVLQYDGEDNPDTWHIERANLASLQMHDPDAAANVRRVHDLSDRYFAELLEFEELPMSLSRAEYVEGHAVPAAMLQHDGPLGSAREAFARGLAAAVHPQMLARWRVSGHELSCVLYGGDAAEAFVQPSAVEGSDGDFFPLVQEAFQVALEDDLMEEEYAPLVEALWLALDGKPSGEAFRRGFVRFATACPSPPSPFQSELLSVSLAFAGPGKRESDAWNALPTAHTCANAVELPDYLSALRAGAADSSQLFDASGVPKDRAAVVNLLASRLRNRFSIAMEFCGDYDLDSIGDDSPRPYVAAPAPASSAIPREMPVRSSRVNAGPHVPFVLPGTLFDSDVEASQDGCGVKNSALWGPVLRSSPKTVDGLLSELDL